MRNSWKMKFAAAAAALVLASSCAAFGAEPANESRVLARVEGAEITEAEIDAMLQSMGPQGMMMYGNPQGRQAILNELVSVQLYALEGAKAKLDETPEVQRAIRELRTRLLAQGAMRETVKDVAATEEEARAFYGANPGQFTQPETVHVRHILISDDAVSADNIAKIQADIKAGVSFDEIAKSVSICPSAPQGGDLGNVSRGQMVPEFEEAAFAMKEPGSVSEPVKTQFGWHLIKLESRTDAALVPFDDVKAQLLQYLSDQKRQETLIKHSEDLRNEYKVEMLVNFVSEDIEAKAAAADPTDAAKQ